MSYSPEYYAARIAEVKAESEARARELFNRALSGDISYTEAWYSLPGPTPNVEVVNLGGMGPRPQLHYNVQYPFLPAADASRLKALAEGEFQDALDLRAVAQSAIPVKHDETARELKEAMETSRRAFDISVSAIAQRKAQVDELRAKLAGCEKAYETELCIHEAAKQMKDVTEAEHLDYTSKASAIMQVAKEKSEVAVNRLAKYRNDNVARQKAETEAWIDLWQDKDTATFNEKGRVAQAALARSQQDKLSARIEEEARRRMRVDTDFEAAVAARLRELMDRSQ